ncbi:MAG: cohesin domain-containing protein [Bacteroidota bacterium]
MYKNLLTFLLVIAFGLPSFGQQPTIILPEIIVDESEEFEMEVKVNNFTDLITMQYTIQWDPTKLDFVEISNMGLPYMDAATFGDTSINTDNGLLPVAWVDDFLNGVSVDDETVIFTLTMKAKGAVGDSIPLIFIDSPTVKEIVDVTQNPVATTYETGLIVLQDLVNIQPNLSENIQSLKAFPNPFTEQTYLSFDLQKSTDVTVTITDISGKEIYSHTQYMNSGIQQLEIDGSIFPGAGNYIYQAKTTEHQLNGKLIFVK